MDDPDQMGQAVLRSPNMTTVPDPLRSSLRKLMALVGGRFALVPASLGFGPEPNGQIRADLTLVVADARSGKVLWRSVAYGSGASPDHAIKAAMAALPSDVRKPMTYDVTLIPGDGIGPEITAQTVKVLEATGLRFNWDEELAGVAAVEATGTPLPDATVESIRKNALALKGPLTTPVGTGFRSVNVGLRKEFELFANVRPARTIVPGGRFENVDIVLVRENLEGLYIGVEHFVADRRRSPRGGRVDGDRHPRAAASGSSATPSSTPLKHGRRKVTIVHKANILKMVSGLFLEVGRTIAKEYEGQVESNDMIVDNTAMQLVMRPEQFDVMVTTNMFGDILSDEVSGLVGGLGLAPGANIGTKAAIFEAVHGSAPDIAGKGLANPSAQMLAAAMMLDHLGRAGPGRADPRRHRRHHRAGRHPHPRPRAAPPARRSSGMRLLGGLPEVPCARCGGGCAGLPWGDLCPDCLGRTEAACNQAGQPHLPRGDGADGGIRRAPHARRPDGTALRSHRRPGYLHHRSPHRHASGHGVSQMTAAKRGSREAGKQLGSMRIVAMVVLLTSPLPLSPLPPLHAQTSLTIYNDGRVLVRRNVPANVPKGASSQRLTLGALDPATVFSLDSSVTLDRVSYDGAVDEASVLRRSVGKRLVFRLSDPRDTVSALVLGVDPLRLQLPDGRISFTPPGLALYPSDVVVVEPTVIARCSEHPRPGSDAAGLLHQRGLLAGQLSDGARAGGCPGHRHGCAALRIASGRECGDVPLSRLRRPG